MTSQRIFGNMRIAIENQAKTLTCTTDGTFKLHFGKWVLVNCETESVGYANGSYVHRFIPWCYMFVKTESQYAYEQLFRSMRYYANEFFNLILI